MGGGKMFEHNLFFNFSLNLSITSPIPPRQLKTNEPETPQTTGKCLSLLRTSEKGG